MTQDAATRRQIEAAHPGQSTWLSANAGSGKTRVLTDRVARLLLDGVAPDHILCLTYTKAAAAEMQNRLFQRLGDWAMLDDARLTVELGTLGVAVPDDGFLNRARTLFAHAIETPGGLRIQTIHSFCAALLRRFPLEAGVSPQFTEIEDRAAELLREDVLEQMALGPDVALVQAVAQHDTNDTLEALAKAVTQARTAFGQVRRDADFGAAYGLSEGTSEATLLQSVFQDDVVARLTGIVPALLNSSSNDVKAGEALARVTEASLASLQYLEDVLLYGSSAKTPYSAKVGTFPTKPLRKVLGASVMDWLDALMTRVESARDTRLSLAAARRDRDLHHFARAFLARYEAEKLRRGWLDFDDLIDRAHALLTDPKVAAWVMYRLDGGIDHILVDEAQDTSPRQWAVIELLTQEFTAGQGARSDVSRTVFVVGDKKQSIYSFQGADAAEFDRMRDVFSGRLGALGDKLHRRALAYSFRSAAPVLGTVDQTFVGREASGFAQDEPHSAFFAAMPGRVDLWPRVPRADKEDAADWHRPVDHVSPRHPHVVQAQRVAFTIDRLIRDRHPMPATDGQTSRPVQAGDFLILVRARNKLFSEIIRACKQAGLPIAGADRLKVMAELAVRDIGAFLAFLDLPQDNYSLAVALKSPLFGLDEQALFTLAHGRGNKPLWEVFREQADRYGPQIALITDMLQNADFLRPYDLIDRLLSQHDGRRRLLSRLGDEAQDGIDALLSQALSYERTEVPSLTGFLHWMHSDDLEIKRQADSAGDKIRVMTVHGAKGLESPVVILPDCGGSRPPDKDPLLVEDGRVFWKLNKAEQPARQVALVASRDDKSARERDRLLYVAMTRAERWLIVAAEDPAQKSEPEDWYALVRGGLTRAGAVGHAFDFGPHGAGEGLRLEAGAWDTVATEPPVPSDAGAHAPMPDLPDWVNRRAPAGVTLPKPLSPSELGGAKALPGDDGEETEAAKRRGTAVHSLLEHIPRMTDVTANGLSHLLADLQPDLPAEDRAALVTEAQNVVGLPALDWVFATDALAEVAIVGDVPGFGRMSGKIDRLIVGPELVIAVDFKTNRVVPAAADLCPEGLLRQMGAYHALLSGLYPGRRIETGILWTWTAAYMPLPQDMVAAALRRAHLDLDAPGS